jgi:hypothetical protein
MKVGVTIYAVASRTYVVEVSDGLSGDDLLKAVNDTDAGKWERVVEWDEESDFDGNRDPVSIVAIDKNGDCDETLWEG